MRCVSLQPFWPPALAQQALPAIILAVLRRFRGAARFRGLRPFPSQGVPFWPSGLTLQSSGRAYGTPLTLAVSPFIFPLYAGQYLFQRFAFLKGFSLGVLALCRSSPAGAAPVLGLFGLQRFRSKRHQLSFLQRCAASVAQRFCVGCARHQIRALPSGLRV